MTEVTGHPQYLFLPFSTLVEASTFGSPNRYRNTHDITQVVSMGLSSGQHDMSSRMCKIKLLECYLS